MDWIIAKSEKFDYHTDLSAVTKPFYHFIDDYNWLISCLEFCSLEGVALPINHNRDYFILTGEEFKQILNNRVQFIWGVIIGIPLSETIKIAEDELPSAEVNENVWKSGNLQYPKAKVEIVCFDSSYTIVKFTDKNLSLLFKNYFDEEAIDLEKFSG